MLSRTTPSSLGSLTDLVAAGGVVILSGAGMSTDSGIPDYRGPDGQRRVQPMTIAQFRDSSANRQRYWARAYAGWDRFRAARPNPAHAVVAELQRRGLVGTVITQNVDGLHQEAGSVDVIELHGTLGRVRCLACGRMASREEVQGQLAAGNPEFLALAAEATATRAVIQPDGDVALPPDLVGGFRSPRCPRCDGDVMKPDVVLFGDSVPRDRVDACLAAVDASRALLVLGSSLQVMSGLRFVRRAATCGHPVASITRGPTRGDNLITLRVDTGLAPTLTELVARLDRRGGQ